MYFYFFLIKENKRRKKREIFQLQKSKTSSFRFCIYQVNKINRL